MEKSSVWKRKTKKANQQIYERIIQRKKKQ